MGNRPATRTVLDMYKLYDRDPVITAKNEEEKERKKHLEFETKTQWRGGNNRVEDEDPVGRNSRAPLLSEHNQKLMYRHVIITARTDELSDAELMAPTARKPTLVETSAVVVLPSCLIKGRKTKKQCPSVLAFSHGITPFVLFVISYPFLLFICLLLLLSPAHLSAVSSLEENIRHLVIYSIKYPSFHFAYCTDLSCSLSLCHHHQLARG